jgi:hypothetical protein
MLQNLLDPRCEKVLQESDLRVVLRVVRTIIWHFHGQLKNKCSVFMQALLGGTLPVLKNWSGKAVDPDSNWTKPGQGKVTACWTPVIHQVRNASS